MVTTSPQTSGGFLLYLGRLKDLGKQCRGIVPRTPITHVEVLV